MNLFLAAPWNRLCFGRSWRQAEAAAIEADLTELGWKLSGNIELKYR